ncbi:MAG: hypothetical protein J0I28_09830 [Caulobacterales bacterium]|nr:hypothetical protein [Caulobacterales bacterium]
MAEVDKRRHLRNLRSGPPSITYRPARRAMPDALNIQAALPMIVAAPSKEVLLEQVRSASRNSDEADSNAEVIELTYDFVREQSISVEAYEFGALRLSAQYGVTFWANAIFRKGDKLFVIIPDFRRGRGFNQAAVKFIISAAHERISKMAKEFADIEFAVLSFPARKDHPRTIRLEFISQSDLFSYEQLRGMTEEALSIWEEVCDERLAEQRKKAANDDDGLFGWASQQAGSGKPGG